MNIIKFRKVYFTISSILVAVSLFGLFSWGLPLGIDFTGGSLMEVEYTMERPQVKEVQEKISDLDLGDVFVQPIGEKGVILRFKSVNEEAHQEILTKLRTKSLDMLAPSGEDGEYIGAPVNNPENKVIEKRFNSIGPVIGQELKQKTIYAIFIALLIIVSFIAWAFRKVSKPVASWKYGIIAIIALFHDILIVVGVFVFLGRFMNVELNAPFVAALLTILGYSVNDTIVIFDRVRENLKHYTPHFSETVNKSVNQNLVRSVYTSLTTLFVLSTLFFFGGESIKYFVLALIIGIISGTYSSIFLASPMLVTLERFRKK
jgi:preprotein translocase subunit SecF